MPGSEKRRNGGKLVTKEIRQRSREHYRDGKLQVCLSPLLVVDLAKAGKQPAWTDMSDYVLAVCAQTKARNEESSVDKFRKSVVGLHPNKITNTNYPRCPLSSGATKQTAGK